jgi:hypothetical protein
MFVDDTIVDDVLITFYHESGDIRFTLGKSKLSAYFASGQQDIREYRVLQILDHVWPVIEFYDIDVIIMARFIVGDKRYVYDKK